MKKILVRIFLPTFLIFLTLLSCKKNEIKYGDFDVVTPDQALLKVNYVSGYSFNPGVVFKLNNENVSNPITFRTPFPGGGFNTGGGSTADYLALSPGNKEFGVMLPKKGTSIDSVSLFKTNISIEAGKNYTIHITDTGANMKSVLLADNVTKPDTGKAHYKFVNLMPNVPAVDLYYGTTVVAANIQYLKASSEFVLPTTNVPALAWTIREAGTPVSSTALATYTSANTISPQRVYTVFALGYKGLASATDVRRPYVSFLLNK
jgi:hypothetical protein